MLLQRSVFILQRSVFTLTATPLIVTSRRTFITTEQSSPKPTAFVEHFTQQFGVMVGTMSTVALLGGIISALGYHNDAKVAALDAKLDGFKAEMSERMSGVIALLGEKEKTIDGKMAGIKETVTKQMEGTRSEAKAAALEVMKDYGVSVAGGVARRTR
jgi:hypothetical protein